MYGYISEMDDVVGDVIDALRDSKELENTLIIFSSDNGAPPALNVRDRNWPLRGYKTQIFEGGVKVPAFISGGILPESARGTQFSGLAQITDCLPTLNITESSPCNKG